MERRSNSPPVGLRQRPTGALLAPLLLLLLLLLADTAADTNLYRCVASDGKVEFRQTFCAENTEEREVRVEDRKTGWEPAKTGVEKKARGSATPNKRKRKAKNDDADRSRQKEQCWEKRQLLETVSWKLRRGYKAGKGVELRHKRRAYEDYVSRYCD